MKYATCRNTIEAFYRGDLSASNNRNVFASGKRLFSYGNHYVMGMFLDNGIKLATRQPSSVTTNKHSSIARLCSDYVLPSLTISLERNIKYLREDIEESTNKLSRARKQEYKDIHQDDIDEYQRTIIAVQDWISQGITII